MTRLFASASAVLLILMIALLLVAPAQGATPTLRSTVPPTNTPQYHPEIALIPTLTPRPCPPSAQYLFTDGEGQLYLVTIKAVCAK